MRLKESDLAIIAQRLIDLPNENDSYEKITADAKIALKKYRTDLNIYSEIVKSVECAAQKYHEEKSNEF